MREKLTQATVRDAEHDPDRITYVWDTEQRGLGLKLYRTGSRSFFLDYRSEGRQRRVSLGKWPETSIQAARECATEHRREINRGGDPIGDREALRDVPTVRRLSERFLAEHAASRAPATERNYRMLWKLHILPVLGTRRVDQVTWEDIERLKLGMAKKPYMANRMLQLVNMAWRLAYRWRWLDRSTPNPGGDHDRYREQRRGQALENDDLSGLGAALAAEKTITADALHVVLLTGWRPGEVLALRWEDVTGRVARLPATKTGPRTAYVGKAAWDVVAPRQRAEGLVFPSRVTGRQMTDLGAIWRRVKTAAKLDASIRLYDAGRHTFTTTALELGVPLDRVKRLVGHRIDDITAGRYGHVRHSVVLRDADTVSCAIQAALEGQEIGGVALDGLKVV